MADTAQINPKIKLATKVRLMDFCKERGHAQGEVVTAALEAYLTPADGDAQALLFQKIQGLEHGMKDIVTLLGTVVQHLEKQTKPPPPKIATREELYPALAAPGTALPVADEPSAPPPRSSWRAIFAKRGRP